MGPLKIPQFTKKNLGQSILHHNSHEKTLFEQHSSIGLYQLVKNVFLVCLLPVNISKLICFYPDLEFAIFLRIPYFVAKLDFAIVFDSFQPKKSCLCNPAINNHMQT